MADMDRRGGARDDWRDDRRGDDRRRSDDRCAPLGTSCAPFGTSGWRGASPPPYRTLRIIPAVVIRGALRVA